MNIMILILAWMLIALLVAALWNTLFDDDDNDNYPEP